MSRKEKCSVLSTERMKRMLLRRGQQMQFGNETANIFMIVKSNENLSNNKAKKKIFNGG
jgi:hypothetical protein